MILTGKENLALGMLRGAIFQEFRDAAEGAVNERFSNPKLKFVVEITEESPWINIHVEGAEPYDNVLDLPRDYAMWKRTRAIHRVRHGEVMDDEPVLEESI